MNSLFSIEELTTLNDAIRPFGVLFTPLDTVLPEQHTITFSAGTVMDVHAVGRFLRLFFEDPNSINPPGLVLLSDLLTKIIGRLIFEVRHWQESLEQPFDTTQAIDMADSATPIQVMAKVRTQQLAQAQAARTIVYRAMRQRPGTTMSA